jgi:5'-3' exonuclease
VGMRIHSATLSLFNMDNDTLPVILIDFSNLMNVCYWPAVSANKADPKYTIEGTFITNLQGKLSTLDAEFEGLHDYRVICVEDSTPTRKLGIYKDYKANRPAKEFDPRPLGKEFLKKGIWEFCHSPGEEADDVIATLVKAYREKNTITIISGDRDLWQLKQDGVRIYNPATGKFVDEAAIIKAFGVTEPRHIPLVKSLWGDSGDNVPNAVPRMQKQLYPFLHKTDGSIRDMSLKVAQGFVGLSDRCKQLWLDGKDQMMLNYELVKLKEDCNVVFD